ncbi:MAG: hypothetical protein U0835_00985 [Isosphaeraceae bacterium]
MTTRDPRGQAASDRTAGPRRGLGRRGVVPWALALLVAAVGPAYGQTERPKWTLQPAPFVVAAGVTGQTPESLENAFQAAAERSGPVFFELLESNSALASVAKAVDVATLNLKDVTADYLLVNPVLSEDIGARSRTLSALIYSREPFFRVRSISVSADRSTPVGQLAERFWGQVDAPMPIVDRVGGKFVLRRVAVSTDLLAATLPFASLDTDGNLQTFPLNNLENRVTAARSHNRLGVPFHSNIAPLTIARWGRNAQKVDVLGVKPSASPKPTTDSGRSEFAVIDQLELPGMMLFGEGFNRSNVALEDVTFIAHKRRYFDTLSACFRYKGGLGGGPGLERSLVFISRDAKGARTPPSVIDTRRIIKAYGGTLIRERELLKDLIRDRAVLKDVLQVDEVPSVRLDPTGGYWTYYSPTADGLLVFPNGLPRDKAPFAFAFTPPETDEDPRPVCQYRPATDLAIVEHEFLPNGRAIVMILEHRKALWRKVVLWDFRADREVVGEERPLKPLSLVTVGQADKASAYELIRFGVTDPGKKEAILMLTRRDASYEVLRLEITDQLPSRQDLDRDTILVRRYFNGSFHPDYKKYNGRVCPLAIEPELNLMFQGGLRGVEVLRLYPQAQIPS